MEEDHHVEPTPQLAARSAGAPSGATPEELARLQALISSLGGVTGNRTGVHRMMQPGSIHFPLVKFAHTHSDGCAPEQR